MSFTVSVKKLLLHVVVFSSRLKAAINVSLIIFRNHLANIFIYQYKPYFFLLRFGYPLRKKANDNKRFTWCYVVRVTQCHMVN